MEEKAKLDFHPIFNHVKIGIGTWAWGDRLYWGFGKGYTESDLSEAFNMCVKNGVVLFDTAEIYGQGRSEKILGKLISSQNEKIVVASKFMPFPWRLSKRSLLNALKRSLSRLNLTKIDLYQIHMPLPPVRIESWMESMAEAVQNNLIKTVGISNFDLEQTHRAVESLRKLGVPIVSNQVEYSLVERRIENNGVFDYCNQNGIKIIAYSPIGMGVLSGKYSSENPLQGLRGSRFSKNDILRYKPLIEMLKKIGADHGGKSSAQVAINWVIAKGALPIPGVKNIHQAEQNTEVLSWSLTDDEVSRLEELSNKVISPKP